MLDSRITHYTKNIQTDVAVINDIAKTWYDLEGPKKMLVFGLGYDSPMWYAMTDKATYFVEDDIRYINSNPSIDPSHIAFYKYETTVGKSFKMTEEEIDAFLIPPTLLANGPYDLIYIDGPRGYDNSMPGRLLPIYWSKKYLSKPGTVIYIDDSNRPLETYCIQKYFEESQLTKLDVRLGSTKISI
jgi:hypothetical protein